MVKDLGQVGSVVKHLPIMVQTLNLMQAQPTKGKTEMGGRAFLAHILLFWRSRYGNPIGLVMIITAEP